MAYYARETDIVKQLVNANSKVQLACHLKGEREKRMALVKFIADHMVSAMLSDQVKLDAFAETVLAAEFFDWDLDGIPDAIKNHINEYAKRRTK